MLETIDSASGVFEQIDTNHDGDISQAELEQALGPTGPAPIPRAATPTAPTKRVAVVDMTSDVLKSTDTNHDGIISREELQRAIRDIFDRADTNHDGVISRAELRHVVNSLNPSHREKPAKEHVDKQTVAHKAAAPAQSSQEHVDKVKRQINRKEMAARHAAADARWEEEADKLKSKIAGNQTVAQHAAADMQPSQAAAYGDPHCRNIRGESFDIQTTGQMTMLQVPGFKITAKIGHISNHDSCSPTVIQEVTIGGAWLGRGDDAMTITPGSHGMPLVPASWMRYFESESAPPGVSLTLADRHTPSNSELYVVRMNVFQTMIKLIQRRGTRSGVDYLDMRVYKIAALGKDIGGLLGNDPHDVESAPSTQCLNANTVARLNDAGAVERGSTGRGMMSVAR